MKDGRGAYLLKNTFVFALGTIGTKLIVFLLVPLYTNVLTTSQYGVVDLMNTIGTVIVPVVTFNMGEAIMRFSLDKDAKRNSIMSIGLVTLVISAFISMAIFPLSSLFNSIKEYSGYLYFYIVSLGFSTIFQCYLRGKDKLLYYSIGGIINSLSMALFHVLFLAVFKKTIDGYLLGCTIANFITAAFGFIVGNVWDVLCEFKFDKKLTLVMAKYSILLIPNSFMWWILNSSDRIMVTSMIGTDANGIYAVSYKIPTILSSLASIFNTAWFYSALREEESEDIETYSNYVFNEMFSILIIAAVGLMAVIKQFLKIYVPEAYSDAWRYTPFLIIGCVFLTLGTFLATSYTVHKDSKGFLISGTCGAIINVVLNYILIPRVGIFGAAIATAIGYIFVFAYRVYDTRKYLHIKLFTKFQGVNILLLVLTAFSMFISNGYSFAILFVELCVALFINRSALIMIIRGFIGKVCNRKV